MQEYAESASHGFTVTYYVFIGMEVALEQSGRGSQCALFHVAVLLAGRIVLVSHPGIARDDRNTQSGGSGRMGKDGYSNLCRFSYVVL